MITTDAYTIGIEPNTRSHKGFFVRDTAYKLIEIDQAGWALICQDNTTCHYVDPACLRETADSSND
jgi:hypothetical protein